jgi:hypothetical protein
MRRGGDITEIVTLILVTRVITTVVITPLSTAIVQHCSTRGTADNGSTDTG